METVRIYCENTSSYEQIGMGSTLRDLSERICPMMDGDLPVLGALVDNRLRQLDYKILSTHNVRFIGYDHPAGRRTYIRSLCFVLQNVIRSMYPDKSLAIDYSLPSGLYCEIREKDAMEDGRPKPCFVTDEQVEEIEMRMRTLIAADKPFNRVVMTNEEACDAFAGNSQTEKVNLAKSLGRFEYDVYLLDGLADTFYGPLGPATG